jgi:RimJ/RimL family protein N-acetyltransferase
MKEIITPRLLLRRPQLTDIDAVHKEMTRVWGTLQLWMSWAYDGHETREAVEKFIRAGTNSLSKDGILLGFDRQTGDFVISTGLHAVGDTTDEYETGYWVAQEYLGRGYATEAANAIIRYAFHAQKAKIMRINYFADNDRSRRVIEKLGFSYVETRKAVHKRCSDGELLDSHEYIMTDPAALPPLDVKWG